MTQSSAAVVTVIIKVKLNMLLVSVNSNIEAKSTCGFQRTLWEEEMSFLEQNVATAVTDGPGWVLEQQRHFQTWFIPTEDL